jgi:hypothetical protein
MLFSSLPLKPTPPRSVAEVAGITTNKSTDIIALLKSVGEERKTKNDTSVIDVELLDESEKQKDKLATIFVSVFGADKVQFLKRNVGEPLVFFNLVVMCDSGKLTINHYQSDAVDLAPVCDKTTRLRDNKDSLSQASNRDIITSTWTPTYEKKDVSGCQPLSCAAFLDFSTGNPDAALPPIMQLMWFHINEPDCEDNVLDSSGERIWFTIKVQDLSGSANVGVPERVALALSNIASKEEFLIKKANGELNMPLLCHARITRMVRTNNGTYVNHVMEQVEPVSWDLLSAPNKSYNDILAILNNCPTHEEGLLFAFLDDVKPDPHYGFHLVYDGQEGPRCSLVAVLVACDKISQTDVVGTGFKVTSSVTDAANSSHHSGAHPAVGYCTLSSLPGFRLDPPRGKQMRYALLVCSKKDAEGLHIHKLEYVENSQIDAAVKCFRKLRKVCTLIHTCSSEKRSHDHLLEKDGTTPVKIKKARTLQAAPSAASLDD